MILLEHLPNRVIVTKPTKIREHHPRKRKPGIVVFLRNFRRLYNQFSVPGRKIDFCKWDSGFRYMEKI